MRRRCYSLLPLLAWVIACRDRGGEVAAAAMNEGERRWRPPPTKGHERLARRAAKEKKAPRIRETARPLRHGYYTGAKNALLEVSTARPGIPSTLFALRGGGAAAVTNTTPRTRHPISASTLRNLVSASAFSVVGGSFYLWSMLIPSLQSKLGCSRASLSAVFSFSTVCFTAGTSLGPRALFGRAGIPVAGVFLLASWVSSLGLLLSASAGVVSLPVLACGYAGIFGLASGIMYALNMKVVNAPGMFDGWQGIATSIIVSFRPLGAPFLAPMVRWALSKGGASKALISMAVAVSLLTLPVAWLISNTTWEDLGQETRHRKTETMQNNGKENRIVPPSSAKRGTHTKILALLWTCMFFGSFPGMLAHGHAGAMAVARGGTSTMGVSAMATGSLWGRLSAGE